MTSAGTLHDVERELDRVVTRLSTMPLAKAAQAEDAVHAAATALVESCRLLDPRVPADATPPWLGAQGYGPLIAVLGGDWLAAARTAEHLDAGSVLDILVTLRRSLP